MRRSLRASIVVKLMKAKSLSMFSLVSKRIFTLVLVKPTQFCGIVSMPIYERLEYVILLYDFFVLIGLNGV